MATQNAEQTAPGAANRTVLANRLNEVLAACRFKTAVPPE